MNVKIVIPAKGHSSRVANKNLRPFFGKKSLLEILIEKVKDLNVPVVVNSESDEVLAIAKTLGVIPQVRPKEFSRDETTPRELARYIAEENDDIEYILYAHCTNPLISKKHFETALQIQPEKWKGFDSINSAYYIQKHIWNIGINHREALYDVNDRPATQGIKNITAFEYSINLVAQKTLLEHGDFIGINPAFLYIPHDEVIDIDEEIDFEIAQGIYARRNGKETPDNLRERKINVIKKEGMGTRNLRGI